MIIEGDAARNVYVDGRLLTPQRSQKVWNHSPDGFNWGYGGSGPAQLALAILLEAEVPKQRAIELHQPFKWKFIAPLPAGEPFCIEIDLHAWYAAGAPEADEVEA